MPTRRASSRLNEPDLTRVLLCGLFRRPWPASAIRHLLFLCMPQLIQNWPPVEEEASGQRKDSRSEALRRRRKRAFARDLQQAARRSPPQWSPHGILHSLPALYGPWLPGGDDTSLQRLVAWPSALPRSGVIIRIKGRTFSQRHEPIRRCRLIGRMRRNGAGRGADRSESYGCCPWRRGRP
jgi:hypothetical protein